MRSEVEQAGGAVAGRNGPDQDIDGCAIPAHGGDEGVTGLDTGHVEHSHSMDPVTADEEYGPGRGCRAGEALGQTFHGLGHLPGPRATDDRADRGLDAVKRAEP